MDSSLVGLFLKEDKSEFKDASELDDTTIKYIRNEFFKKTFVVPFIVVVISVSILTGCKSDTSATVALASEQTIVEISDADVEEYVSAVKLVIKSGILYVVVYDGSVYKTAIEADSIIVDRPEFGKGTVSTAEIRKDNQTVMFFSRSQVEASNMTQEEVEEKFGPVIKVEVSPDSEKPT